MSALLLKLRKNKDLHNTAIVGVGTVLASFFSYLLQLFLGRLLTVEDFGSFNALLSLSYLIGVPAMVFSISLIKTISNLFSREDYPRITKLFWVLVKSSILLGISVFFIVFMFRNMISTGLKINDVFSISLFGLLMGFSFLSIIPSAYLQGLQKFTKFALFQVISSFNRFLIPTLLVYFGFKLQGVFGGMVISSGLLFFIGFLLVKESFTKSLEVKLDGIIKNILSFSTPVFFVNFCMMALNNVDVILVKKFFDPEVAGYYAGTVTLGKILLFGTAVVTVIMFPQVSALYAKNGNYIKRFKKLFLLQLLLVLGGLSVYLFAPRMLTTLFFGNRFTSSVKYLPLFAIFVSLYVLINFLTMFSLAIDKKQVYLFLIPCVILQGILIYLYHDTIFDVIKVNIFTCIIALTALLAFTLPKLCVNDKKLEN